jgi:hypothetical protein
MTPPNFCIFVVISLFKRTWSIIWTVLNSLYPRRIWTHFDWNWPAGSEKKIFQEPKTISVFSLFCYHLPLEKDIDIHLNNFKSPFPRDDLCYLRLKLAQQFWRRSRKCNNLTDRRRTKCDQKSSLELSARVS